MGRMLVAKAAASVRGAVELRNGAEAGCQNAFAIRRCRYVVLHSRDPVRRG